MKKRLTIILAVALTVISCCALLIGCTPSKPSDFLTKWKEGKNVSATTSLVYDTINVVDKDNNPAGTAAGKFTYETTYYKNGDNLMIKNVVTINIKENGEKDGKDAKTDIILPASAIIVEFAKDNKCNIYTYRCDSKIVKTKDEKKDKYKFTVESEGVWEAEQYDKDTFLQLPEYLFVKGEIDSVFEDADALSKLNLEKGKNGVYKNVADEEGNYITAKLKSSNMVFTYYDKDNTVIETTAYNASNKIVIPSGAKDALNVFLDTKEGVITKIETVKDANVYTIKIEDKEYTVKSKVTGYDKLKDAKVDDVVSVRLKKGTFGGYSITEVFELV